MLLKTLYRGFSREPSRNVVTQALERESEVGSMTSSCPRWDVGTTVLG